MVISGVLISKRLLSIRVCRIQDNPEPNCSLHFFLECCHLLHPQSRSFEGFALFLKASSPEVPNSRSPCAP